MSRRLDCAKSSISKPMSSILETRLPGVINALHYIQETRYDAVVDMMVHQCCIRNDYAPFPQIEKKLMVE